MCRLSTTLSVTLKFLLFMHFVLAPIEIKFLFLLKRKYRIHTGVGEVAWRGGWWRCEWEEGYFRNINNNKKWRCEEQKEGVNSPSWSPVWEGKNEKMWLGSEIRNAYHHHHLHLHTCIISHQLITISECWVDNTDTHHLSHILKMLTFNLNAISSSWVIFVYLL